MIIKLEKVINCSSEHPSYPASNLLQYRSNSSWRCAKPGEMLATVTFQLAEPSCITGLDIGNYRSCVVIITASTSSEPDNWIPIVNHQFMTHDEAANGKFKDQVQLFTKKDLNPDTLKIKFDRVKVTCMQSANLKELFGLSFIILRTEVVVDLGLDAFGKFKLKKNGGDSNKPDVDEFREKYLKAIANKKTNYKDELRSKIKETSLENFSKRQEEGREPMKRPLLEKLEAGKADEVFGPQNKPIDKEKTEGASNGKASENENVNNTSYNSKPVVRTPFGDVVPASDTSSKTDRSFIDKESTSSRKRFLSSDEESENERINKKIHCTTCNSETNDQICKTCNKLPPPKQDTQSTTKKKTSKASKPRVPFNKLLENVTFSLSGYVNPQRDEIRRKALQMGAKYIADPNTRNNRCTHLICAFKNTPKYQQLKGHSKIVSHTFIEECYNEKTRFPWRRYALRDSDRNQPESEEEIEADTAPRRRRNPFSDDTDSDSDN